MKTIEEAFDWLSSLQSFGIRPGLERMHWLLERLDHPERALQAIHVAGTNGKGSTVQFLSGMMQEAGLSVGTFTSPYTEHYSDRIAVCGQEISADSFLDLANTIRPLTEELAATDYGAATEFEVMTVIAIVYFAKIAFPDVVIFEVGLGGRLDSTNVIHPLVTIITNVSEDHTDVLGESLEEIAREKAGIIKSGIPVITGAKGVARNVIENTAKAMQAKCYQLGREFFYTDQASVQDGERFCFQSPLSKRDGLQIRLQGKHQVENAALALMAIDHLYFFYGLYLEQEEMKKGLLKAVIPGRFEKFMTQPPVILDGAHNPAAAKQLTETLVERFPNHSLHIVFAALQHKNSEEMIARLEKVASRMTFTSFSHQRAHAADTLAMQSRWQQKEIVEQPTAALQTAIRTAGEDHVIVVTGSLYLIAEIRRGFAKNASSVS